MAAEDLGRVPDTYTTTDESSGQRFFFLDDTMRPSGTIHSSRIIEEVRFVLNLAPEEREEIRRTAREGIRFSLAPPSVPVMAEPPAEPAAPSPMQTVPAMQVPTAESSAPFDMQNVMLESDFKYT